jgi:hypothetical protein
VRATGSQIIYRLGESIEHTTVKRFVHPPKDPEKWAAVALGIIRHYNEGWAGGFRWDVRYWEIWNEPDVRPNMWSGSDEDYYQLYRTTAKAIRSSFPDLKIGGPGIGNTGAIYGGALQPTPFLNAFLDLCKREELPVDFLSWHCYTNDPMELVVRARAVRRLLDDKKLFRTRSFLDEWGYLPDNSWEALQKTTPAFLRQRFYDRMSGPEGAAFVATTLLKLQDAPVDGCCLFHGETGGFGLFNPNGVPYKNYFAIRAVRELMRTPIRVQINGRPPAGVTIVAGASEDRKSATILIASMAQSSTDLRISLKGLPWKGPTAYDTKALNSIRDLQSVREGARIGTASLTLNVEPSSVTLISLRPARLP